MLSNNKLFRVVITINHTSVEDVTPFAQELQQFFAPENTQRLAKTLLIPQELKDFKQKESVDYRLSTLDDNLQLTLSAYPSKITVAIKKYLSREAFIPIITNISDIYSHSSDSTISSRKIGIRFINYFDTKNLKTYGRVFQKNIANVVRDISTDSNLSRSIAVQEYNFSWCKSTIQYGFPNKWYPEVLRDKTLLLDINVYSEAEYEVKDWLDAINSLTEQANKHFKDCMNPKYLVSME